MDELFFNPTNKNLYLFEESVSNDSPMFLVALVTENDETAYHPLLQYYSKQKEISPDHVDFYYYGEDGKDELAEKVGSECAKGIIEDICSLTSGDDMERFQPLEISSVDDIEELRRILDQLLSG